MARLAVPSGWAGALIRQRGPLRTYQWLWLLLCATGALIAAAPRILSQPVVYTSTAAATFDARRYGGLFTGGQPNGEVSSSLFVVDREPYAMVDLRVDLHPEPVSELRRLAAAYFPLVAYYNLRPRDPNVPSAADWLAAQRRRD